MKKSRHATLDESVKKLMQKLGVKPKVCKYCKGEFYPHKNTTREQWKGQKYCSSICNANNNAKTPKPFYWGVKRGNWQKTCKLDR